MRVFCLVYWLRGSGCTGTLYLFISYVQMHDDTAEVVQQCLEVNREQTRTFTRTGRVLVHVTLISTDHLRRLRMGAL